MWDEPMNDREIRRASLYRKIGFYCFLGGVALIYVKHRKMNL